MSTRRSTRSASKRQQKDEVEETKQQEQEVEQQQTSVSKSKAKKHKPSDESKEEYKPGTEIVESARTHQHSMLKLAHVLHYKCIFIVLTINCKCVCSIYTTHS